MPCTPGATFVVAVTVWTECTPAAANSACVPPSLQKVALSKCTDVAHKVSVLQAHIVPSPRLAPNPYIGCLAPKRELPELGIARTSQNAQRLAYPAAQRSDPPMNTTLTSCMLSPRPPLHGKSGLVLSP